jgi:hypothetical protein
MNQQYQSQQYTGQFLQEVIPVVMTLAIAAIVVANAVKAVKEAIKGRDTAETTRR